MTLFCCCLPAEKEQRAAATKIGILREICVTLVATLIFEICIL